MHQSKAAYYAEIFFYPIVVFGLLAAEIVANRSIQFVWLAAALMGVILWTLVEYVLHRFVLHRVPGLASLHAMHHARPGAYIGSPLWASLLTLSIAFLPLWRVGGFEIASGLSSGLSLGYVWYLLVHDAVHRWPLKKGSPLMKARSRHLLHHRRSDIDVNFGVSTNIWDIIFRTDIENGAARKNQLRPRTEG
jgi:sterol desaturase/sphingolipid hydroxylase (fatty acid hydroxylase superfamily)